MPEFTLDTSGKIFLAPSKFPDVDTLGQWRWSDLDAFTQGYIEALFWTECGPDSEELEDKAFSDLAPEALAEILADCTAFQEDNAVLLNLAYDHEIGYTEAQAGHDYWLTRNGHGAGFWDRGLNKVGDELSTACRHSTVNVYLGDDGKVYVS